MRADTTSVIAVAAIAAGSAAGLRTAWPRSLSCSNNSYSSSSPWLPNSSNAAGKATSELGFAARCVTRGLGLTDDLCL